MSMYTSIYVCLSVCVCVYVCSRTRKRVCTNVYTGVLNPPAEDWWWSVAYWDLGQTADGEWLGK